ncbi:MAG: hypothetical protein Q8S55_07930, partial [Methylococcaceae bacterium]|nr:hypothetical protein [Methylococcaceae bacterium]
RFTTPTHESSSFVIIVNSYFVMTPNLTIVLQLWVLIVAFPVRYQPILCAVILIPHHGYALESRA